MFVFSFFRIIKFAFQDLVRNFSLSLMTVMILVLMLLSVNTLIAIRALTNEATSWVKEQIDVSIYFSHDASEDQINEIIDYINSFPEVVSAQFHTAEQELEKFKEDHKDSPTILSSIDELGENPLGPTLVVKTRDPGDYEKIISSLGVPEYEKIIDAKTFGDTEVVIGRVQSITAQVERLSFTLSVLFAVIAFIIIFNTIRVAIYTQRQEIGIKKLVGATNWFVRGPYLMEALIFSFISIFITATVVYFSSVFLDPYVSIVFQKESFLTNYFASNIMWLLSVQFGAVLILNILSGSLAMRKYLRT